MAEVRGLGFPVICKDDYLQRTEEEFATLPVATQRDVIPVVKKRLPGRPRGVITLDDVLIREHSVVLLSSSEEDAEGLNVLQKRKRGAIARPRQYSNWFTAQLWPHIDCALRQCRWRPRETVRYLQKKFRAVNGTGKFEGLNESTVRGWLDGADKNRYSQKVLRAIEAIETEKSPAAIMHPGAQSMWSGIPELETEFVQSLVALREAQAGLNSMFIQFRLRAFLKVRAPTVLRENGGAFSISRSFVRGWVKQKLHWSFRRQTSDCSRLPKQWESLGRNLMHRIAYLVLAHDIPMDLVINADQTGLQLLPVGNEKTYSLKGAKSVLVSGGGDKRQISLMLACTAQGNLLPSQAIFEGKTRAVVPDGQYATLLRHLGWHLTHSQSHWSTITTMRDWVTRILVPWVSATATAKGLDSKNVKCILLLDCYSVHISEDFRSWLKETHPNVYLLFVPANCTSRLQPCDVVLQRPYKCAIQRMFGEYAVEDMTKRMEAGSKPGEVGMETRIVVLRRLICEWLWRAHQDISTRGQMINAGWKKTGILEAWTKVAQTEAAERAAAGELFDPGSILEVKEEAPCEGEADWIGDSTVDEVFRSVVEDRDLPVDLEGTECEEGGGSNLPGTHTLTLVNFVGSSGGKRVCFTQYLADSNVVSPYM